MRAVEQLCHGDSWIRYHLAPDQRRLVAVKRGNVRSGRELARGAAATANCDRELGHQTRCNMKHPVKMIIVSIVALSLAGPFIAPAYATDVPATQSDCEKAGMQWKPKAGKCKPMPKSSLSPAESVLALIGLACALIGLFFTWIEYRNDSRKKRRATQ